MASNSIVLPVLLLLVSSFVIGEATNVTHPGQNENGTTKRWCVANPSASDEQLNKDIEFVCNEVGDECRTVQSGGACYQPATLINHASVVMNIYYQKMQRKYWTCYFNASALVTITDPSYGSCHYDFGGSS